jgi:hypothetical protein
MFETRLSRTQGEVLQGRKWRQQMGHFFLQKVDKLLLILLHKYNTSMGENTILGLLKNMCQSHQKSRNSTKEK